MKFSLPGQGLGPECKRVIPRAVVLRRKLEPWFASLAAEDADSCAIILRIDGSLGTFGPSGVENVKLDRRDIECDLVIADRGWADLSDEEIDRCLRREVMAAIRTCLTAFKIPFDPDGLRSHLLAAP